MTTSPSADDGMPAPDRIHAFVDHRASTQPHAPALRDTRGRLSYAELVAVSREAADELVALGVRAGDRVLVVGENCVAMAVLVIALSRIDAWTILVSARLSEREIDVFIAHASPRRVLYLGCVSADAARRAERHGASAWSWDRLGAIAVGPSDEATRPEPCSSDASQVAALIYTSGTSGAPKGVMLSHANLSFTVLTTVRLRRIGPGDVTYCLLPMAHVVGLAAQLLGSLAGGAEILFESRFSPAEAMRALRDEGVTTFTGVPAVYAKLLEWVRASGDALVAPNLRRIAVAGSPLTATLKADVETLFGLTLHNGYGLTECAPTVAQTRMESPRTDCAVGPPIPGVEARIVDESGTDVASGTIGELLVRSPGLSRRYYRNEAATREAIDADGWFDTGDMARRLADGAIEIVGRSKELIIRSGLNVYPVEVEQAIDSHPDVVQSAVVGRTVDDNEVVVAFVERAAHSTLDAAALESYLRERLAPYKVPGEIRFPVQLPASPTGKVLKNVLKADAETPRPSTPRAP